MKFSTENEKKESFVETLKRLSGLGKPHHEIHRPNPYQQARKETAFTRPYANAELKLAPKTFSEQWNGTKNLVVMVRDVYPYLSVLSAIMVGYMVAKLFVTGLESYAYWGSVIGVTFLVFMIATINEKLKKRELGIKSRSRHFTKCLIFNILKLFFRQNILKKNKIFLRKKVFYSYFLENGKTFSKNRKIGDFSQFLGI